MRLSASLLVLALSACGPSAVIAVNVDRNTAVADSKDAIIITANVKDPSGQPTFGALVTFEVPPPGVLTGVAVSTDVMGNAQTRLTATDAKELTVIINTVGAAKPISLPLTFTAPSATEVTPVRLRFVQPLGNTKVDDLVRSADSSVPTVVLEGENGEKTNGTGSVTVRLTSGSCTGGRIAASSLFTVAARNGEASFAGLKAEAVGTGCSLTADAQGLLPATSTTFDILPK